MQHLLSKIASILIAPIILLANLLHPAVVQSPVQAPQAQYQNLGAALPQATAVFETSLAAPITSTATTMTLAANAVRGGGSVSGYTCFTADEGTAQAEVMCGTVSSTSVTALTRGISYSDGVTSVSANKFAHRRGANIKITDYPILQILKAQNNGEATFPNPISYASGVGPLGLSDIADKEYVLSVVNGGSVTIDKLAVSGTAGETITSGNLVYLKPADGKWWKATAATSSTVQGVQLGIAQGAGTAGALITNGVLIRGTETTITGTGGGYVYASDTAGATSSSTGTSTKIIGQYITGSAGIYFDPQFYYNLSANEKAALAGGSDFGTPSTTNKFVTQSYLSSSTVNTPVVRTYSATRVGDTTTRFDVLNITGNTYRYLYDGTGTDPVINSGTFPIGTILDIQAQNLSAGNKGFFVTTGVGSNYFEISNASGVAENDKTIGTGLIAKGTIWTKPVGLKYIELEMTGGGGGGGASGVSNQNAGAGGGGSGYLKKKILTSSLGATENLSVGLAGLGGAVNSNDGTSGGTSRFGSIASVTGGQGGGGTPNGVGGNEGVGSNGDLNLSGQAGGSGSSAGRSGTGGASFFGAGAPGTTIQGSPSSTVPGAGGGGGYRASGSVAGGDGKDGIIIITEFYQ